MASKVIPLDKRWQLYREAQERAKAAITRLGGNHPPMRQGRLQALNKTLAWLDLYLATFPGKDDKQRVHALLVTIQTTMGNIQDNFKLQKDADARMVMVGEFNEFKRQLEQVRNLLTPMKG